jgi:excinuclease ABC subunit B
VYDASASRAERREAGDRVAVEAMSEAQLGREIKRLERQMLEMAKNLEFEKAARIRDQLGSLRQRAFIGIGAGRVPVEKVA